MARKAPRPDHARKLKQKYGDDFFRELAYYGGSVTGVKKGFGAKSNKLDKNGMTPAERASYWGKINGAKNKGKKRKRDGEAREDWTRDTLSSHGADRQVGGSWLR